MLIFLPLLNVFSSLHKYVVNSLSFLVSVLLCRNVSLCFWATVSALVCLVCSSTVVQNYDNDAVKLELKTSYTSCQLRCNVIDLVKFRHERVIATHFLSVDALVSVQPVAGTL